MNYLKAKDEIKLVITGHEDYLWAKNTIQEKNLLGNFDILFSPSFEQVESQDLAEWILKDQLPYAKVSLIQCSLIIVLHQLE